MSRTRQPRPNSDQNDEEKRLWTQIKVEAKKIDGMITRSSEIGTQIVEIEKQQATLVEAEKPSDAALDDKLESLYRENLRISEQIQHMIEGQGSEMPLLESISILQALREAAGDLTTSKGRSASTNGSKARSMAKRKGAPDDGEESSAPSPRVVGGRLAAGPGREKSARGGSAAPSLREASVKIEDGAESVASSADGPPPSKAGSESQKEIRSSAAASATPLTPTAAQRQALTEGAMVFYRNKGRAQEGEGILCRVTSVIGEGKQRRYEIQDADPESEALTPYRASVINLIPIPMSNAGLTDLAKGKNVLAQYPDTTTFYKAEVVTPWRAKDAAANKIHVRLRFEGDLEEETQKLKEMDVERRFVIPDLK